MSDFCVYLKMPSYLRQWFVHRHGGSEPVHLLRGSIEGKMLTRLTVPLPDGTTPPRQQDNELAVCIPYSKSHDPRRYNHITDLGKKILIDRAKADFDIDLWYFLHDLGNLKGQQKEWILAFMEQRGIREDGSCWDSIAKIYQRLRKIYYDRDFHKKKYTATKAILK